MEGPKRTRGSWWILFGLAVVITPLTRTARAQAEEDEELVESPDADEVGNEDSEYNSGIRMGTPVFSGTGCPAGSVGVAMAPDEKSVSFLMDAFQVIAGNGAAITDGNKRCLVQIPFQVPTGYRMMVMGMDIRGFQQLPRGGRSVLNVGYRLPSPRNPESLSRPLHVARRQFTGPLNEDFQVGARFLALRRWTKCGDSFTMNIDLNLTTASPNRGDAALSTIDTLDGALREAVKYHVRWKRCTNDGPDPEDVRRGRNGDRWQRPVRPGRPGDNGRPGNGGGNNNGGRPGRPVPPPPRRR
jgi:hypothetical protein